jgi:hypothetical protein
MVPQPPPDWIEPLRTHDTIMRSLWSPPARHDNVFDQKMISTLRNMQETGQKIGKAGGVVDTDGEECVRYPEVINTVKRLVGENAVIHQATFFQTRRPFPIHTDTLRDPALRPWKVVLIPLGCEPDLPSHTVLFNQRWTGLSANFTKGTAGFPSFVHDTVTDYSDVLGLSDEPFPTDFHQKHLQHIKTKMLEGLSLDQIIQWRLGSAIVFDCCQLHTSDDFRANGVTTKRGLTIITTHP